MSAAAEMLHRTSSPNAPWYVVPANRKWYRNWAVNQILIDTLTAMDPTIPAPKDLDGIQIPDV